MQINHYLNFQGQTEAAFQFYHAILGGELLDLTRYADLPPQPGIELSESEKQQILHITLRINPHYQLMGSDYNANFCSAINNSFIQGNNHYISINLVQGQEDEAKRLYEALSKNGEIEMPLAPTFWGALYAAFRDQFGTHWMINCQTEAKPD